MERIPCFKTIEECEKVIISKSIELDIAYSVGQSLFRCFTRLIRTVYIWAVIATAAYTLFTFNNGVIGLKELGIECIIYMVCALLISWVKFNYDNEYKKTKESLLNNLINLCEQYRDYDPNSWETKQIYKRMMNLGGLDINFENKQE